MVSLGTVALDDGDRVDFDRLREQRRRRVLEAMEERGLDVLVLGREPNARYVSGARRLHLPGTRPFGPGCVVVGETGEIHLMSTWDDGIPSEVSHEQLYGISWNPMKLVESVQRIKGVSASRRIGVDAMTPLFRQLMEVIAPSAEVLNAESLLRKLRSVKLDDELMCIRIALAIAEAGMVDAVSEIRPGLAERALQGIFEARMTDFGVTTPAIEGFFGAPRPSGVDPTKRIRRLTSDHRLNHGDVAVCCAGVLYAGYEGSIGRTWPCAAGSKPAGTSEQRDLYRRWSRVWERLADTCRPGVTGADLLAAYEASGEPVPNFPIAYSVGLGYEGAVAGSELGRSFDSSRKLEPGMVLGVQAGIESSHGAYFALETMHITADGHEVLSKLTHGPLAEDS